MPSDRLRLTLRRVGTFNLVALGGFIVQIAVLSWLTRVWDWPYLAATVIAIEAAIAQNYLAHSRWTWSDCPATTRRERLLRPVRYQAATTASLAVNVGVTAAFVSGAGLPVEIANLLAVVSCAALNYTAADRLVFTTPS
jgi:putative flippase GtrA